LGNSKDKKIKSNNKTSRNRTTLFLVIACVVISVTVLSLLVSTNFEPASDSISEDSVNLPKTYKTMSDHIDELSKTHTMRIFDSEIHFNYYLSDDDYNRHQIGIPPSDGVRITLNETYAEQIIEIIKPNSKSVVIYPTFTSAAYQPFGFYHYYGDKCDEKCITDISFENPTFDYTSSGWSAQILYEVGYDFLTDVEVDRNPEILQNYDVVILLHNEYVTKKEFNALSNFPNLIFLHPNALYAEIDVDYDDNTITLIRGHEYPPPEYPSNGFDYEIEMRFHEYEYDNKCLDWKFIEFENGYHLNCYPESVIPETLQIFEKLKELTLILSK
jgi:hypothetical protein